MFLFAFVSSLNECVEISDGGIQFFHSVLQLNELLVLGISRHDSLLTSDI